MQMSQPVSYPQLPSFCQLVYVVLPASPLLSAASVTANHPQRVVRYHRQRLMLQQSTVSCNGATTAPGAQPSEPPSGAHACVHQQHRTASSASCTGHVHAGTHPSSQGTMLMRDHHCSQTHSRLVDARLQSCSARAQPCHVSQRPMCPRLHMSPLADACLQHLPAGYDTCSPPKHLSHSKHRISRLLGNVMHRATGPTCTYIFKPCMYWPAASHSGSIPWHNTQTSRSATSTSNPRLCTTATALMHILVATRQHEHIAQPRARRMTS